MLNNIFHCLISFIIFYGIAIFISTNRKGINKKIVLKGIFLQFIFAVVLIKIPSIALLLKEVAKAFSVMIKATQAAGEVVFGGLANPALDTKLGYILAIQGFPVLIVVGAVSSILTYYGILPAIIRFISGGFRRIFNIGGVLGAGVSVNVFSGMNETPIVIRTYLRHLTHSELFSLMCCGMASISTSIMSLYPVILDGVIENSIVYVISAALISVPGALTLSRIIIPETNISHISESKDIDFHRPNNLLEALSDGILSGGKLVLRIIAMLIGFIALIEISNQILSSIDPSLTMQKILGVLMAPIAWIIGVPWDESMIVGSLLGTKTVLNEIVVFADFVDVAAKLSEKSKLLAIYLLANFANLGSVAVISGVYTGLIPERKSEIIQLSFKAMIVGTLVSFLTGAIVNILL